MSAARILDAIRAQPPSQRRAERLAVLRARYAHVTEWESKPAPAKSKPAPAGPQQLEIQ